MTSPPLQEHSKLGLKCKYMDNNALCAGMLAQIASLVFIQAKFNYSTAVGLQTTFSSKQRAKQKFSSFCLGMNLHKMMFGLHDTCNCFILVGLRGVALAMIG